MRELLGMLLVLVPEQMLKLPRKRRSQHLLQQHTSSVDKWDPVPGFCFEGP